MAENERLEELSKELDRAVEYFAGREAAIILVVYALINLMAEEKTPEQKIALRKRILHTV